MENLTKIKKYYHQVDAKDNKNSPMGLNFQLLKIEILLNIIFPKYTFSKMNVKLRNNNFLHKYKRNIHKFWIIKMNRKRLFKKVIVSTINTDENKTIHHIVEWATQLLGKHQLNFNQQNRHQNNTRMQKWVQIWFVIPLWF